MEPRNYGPFPYTPINRRPKLKWPNGARVAVWVIPNIEFFPNRVAVALIQPGPRQCCQGAYVLTRESDAFMAIIKSSQDQQLRLTVYSVKTNSARDVTITPSDRWGGANKPPGTLGATIRFDQIQSPDEHAWHVLDIHANSPASLAGLCAHTDYILSAVDLIFRDEGDLEYVLSRMLNKRVEFYVYSVASDSVREVSITPNPSWGGDGMLGCDIGRGILHRLPFEKGREQARVAQAEGAEGRGRPGAPAGLPTATPPAGSDGAAAAAGEGSQPAAPMIATAVASRVALDTVPPGTQTVVPVRGGAAAGAALTAVQKRAAAAVLGSFVADAATMGAHWIYDMAELQQRLGSHGATPEFHEPPACPYYDYSSGSLSPYGDEALVLLRCMSAGSDGRLDPALFADALFSWSKEYRDGGGFIDHATQGFQTRMLAGKTWPECGAEDKQANCLGKVAIVVARYAGTGDLVSKVTEAIRVHQDHDEAVNHGVAAALLLEQVVLGSSLQTALELSKASMDGSALAAVEAAEAASSRQSTADMLGELGHQLMPGEPKAALVGRSCGFPRPSDSNGERGRKKVQDTAAVGNIIITADVKKRKSIWTLWQREGPGAVKRFALTSCLPPLTSTTVVASTWRNFWR